LLDPLFLDGVEVAELEVCINDVVVAVLPKTLVNDVTGRVEPVSVEAGTDIVVSGRRMAFVILAG